MSKMVTIEEIQEGMVLAEAVVNSFGQTLLNAGSTIGPNHRKTLKTWNISTIRIKGDSDESAETINPELIKIAEANLKARMKWELNYPIEFDLFNSALGLRTNKSKGAV